MSRSRPYHGLPEWMLRLTVALMPPGSSPHWRARIELWHRAVEADDDQERALHAVARIEGEQ